MNSNKHILWSANDPGGMNAIVPVIEALVARGDIVAGIATGPSRTIAQRKGLMVTDAEGYSEEDLQTEIVKASPDVLLAGTSSGDSIDKKIFQLLHGVPSVYVLDAWSNYAMRFSKQDTDLSYLPGAVCVMDELARQEMIAEGIPMERIHVTGNPYFEHFTEGITHDREDPRALLFISQPVRQTHGKHYGFDEYSVIADLIDVIDKLPPDYHLFIRLHPKDSPNKYDAYTSSHVSIASEDTLELSISIAGLVVGMFSPVLIQAAAAGKKVLSYEPGLIGPDPLATNRIGITRKVQNKNALYEVFTEYVAGRYASVIADVSALWPRGAVQRIIHVIDDVVSTL